MFLIECDGKRLLHTGDFRLHGQRGKSVIKALKNMLAIMQQKGFVMLVKISK